ncbi:MAG: PIN domain-containing protein [Candidatus Nanopelagicales bacterium]|nr:PIN domain-containing protein [Candidatus Nanopelagicales bacterium]
MTAIVYCDSSVLLKRTGEEIDSEEVTALIASLAENGATLITSELARVEIRLAFIRDKALTGRTVLADEQLLSTLGGVMLVDLNTDVLAVASQIEAAHLGTLDALHLATALLSGADVLLTRDAQLSRACQEVGMAVA